MNKQNYKTEIKSHDTHTFCTFSGIKVDSHDLKSFLSTFLMFLTLDVNHFSLGSRSLNNSV